MRNRLFSGVKNMPNEQKAALTKADNIVAFSGAFFYTYIYRTSTFLHGAVYP
jgi:hypothetical protein